MAIEYRNREGIFLHPHVNGDITITRAECIQTWDGKIVGGPVRRYLVEQGEWMIPCATYDHAEEIANEIYSGQRKLGDEAAEEAASNG